MATTEACWTVAFWAFDSPCLRCSRLSILPRQGDLNIPKRHLTVSLIAWVLVWVFWLALTYKHHPTFSLAVIVTTSLVGAYAVAAYVNHLILVPRLWTRGLQMKYALTLLATMAILTASALAVIRAAYLLIWGPDADPLGLYKHYAIDLFGMVVHVTAAALVVWLVKHNWQTSTPA